eukprot:TRINITY_DN2663_c0_g1_i4.p1 TRINITY_DN2663_c0_g1~~TRINITY_DN2663_c0_g1_i4.p1  ORF type:complete len:156 (+),score=27.83 TRINITY_DN2663_c0_g1_i4:575-1042(+)
MVTQICSDFDQGCPIQIPPHVTVHDVAMILKKYLRELPDPLIPFELLSNTDSGLSPQVLKDLVESLPIENSTLLEFLISFLVDLSNHSDTNLMDKKNITLAIAPTIVSSQGGHANPLHMLIQMEKIFQAVNLLMNNHHFIFQKIIGKKTGVIGNG